MTADHTAATQVFYTPYVGNQCPIPNGTAFKQNMFAELTLTLNGANYSASAIYDVFTFLDPGDNTTVKIGTGPAWSNSGAGTGARGTGAGTTEIARLGGLWTNNNAITMRNNVTTFSVATKSATFLGSVFIDTVAGQVTCHFSAGQTRKFGVWNAYNRVPIRLNVFDSTASWNYGSSVVRQSNGAAGNICTVFTGLAEEWFENSFMQEIRVQGPGETTGQIGIGFNVTNAFSGQTAKTRVTGTSGTLASATVTARYDAPPALGISTVACCEAQPENFGGTSCTFLGAQSEMTLRSTWNG